VHLPRRFASNCSGLRNCSSEWPIVWQVVPGPFPTRLSDDGSGDAVNFIRSVAIGLPPAKGKIRPDSPARGIRTRVKRHAELTPPIASPADVIGICGVAGGAGRPEVHRRVHARRAALSRATERRARMASLGSTPAAFSAKSSAARVTSQKSAYSCLRARSQVYSSCLRRHNWVTSSPQHWPNGLTPIAASRLRPSLISFVLWTRRRVLVCHCLPGTVISSGVSGGQRACPSADASLK
jgi:hypothetical protein